MKFLIPVICLLTCLSLVFGAAGEKSSPPAEYDLSLLAVNVRKADALLLRSGVDAYLIDTGTEESFPALYETLKSEGVTRLTGVIVTHTHDDHAGGLAQLLESDIAVENLYASGYYNKKKESKHPAVKAAKGTDLEVVFLFAGDTLPLDGARLTVVGPLEKNDDKENNNSLVLLAEGGGGTILLTGDMEMPEEASLMKAGALSRVDVLKVGNHGEGDATSNALIDVLRPSLAVISTNTQDEPDTPDPRVLRLFASWNIPVLVTQDAVRGVQVTLRNGEILTEMK